VAPEKAGSIEALHDVLKNELAGRGDAVRSFRRQRGVAAFGVMTHNVLTGLKRIALKPDYLRARPKRLRFKIFCSPGKLIHHARRLLARVARQLTELMEWSEAWALLPAPV